MSLDAMTSQRANSAYLDTLSRTPATTTGGVNATQASPPADADGDAANAAATPGAIIALSPGAQLFSQVLAAAQGTPNVRADKLAAIQARLAAAPDAGTDVQALAAKMLGNDAH